jgi:DNA-binding response OmpR family regulator
MNPIRLAVVDSDSGFVHVLSRRLDAMGWRYCVLDAPVPPDQLVAMRLNALVVDVETVGTDAVGYVEGVSRAIPGLGLVVCSPRSSVAERVRGLRLGADDWIDKPVHPEEVIARIEAVIRRRRLASVPVETEPVVAGEVEIRADQFQAFARGGSIDLTRREFELLQLLADARGQVLPREEIYQRVWGYAMAHGDRSVDVFVRKLRQKLEARSPGWIYIHTHFGIGYRFQPEPRAGGDGESPGASGAVGHPQEERQQPSDPILTS